MKDENIKEILDKISKEENYIQHSYCKLFNYEANTLLDYITNLQEDLERYKHYFKTSGIQELIEENEYLKKHQRFHKKFGDDYIFCVEGDKETYKDYIFELQERIEKAIEYIKSYNIDFENIKFGEAPLNINDLQKLLNILQGVGKDE